MGIEQYNNVLSRYYIPPIDSSLAGFGGCDFSNSYIQPIDFRLHGVRSNVFYPTNTTSTSSSSSKKYNSVAIITKSIDDAKMVFDDINNDLKNLNVLDIFYWV